MLWLVRKVGGSVGIVDRQDMKTEMQTVKAIIIWNAQQEKQWLD